MKEIDPSLEAYVEAEIIPATRISTARTPRTTSARSSTGASRWPAATTWPPDMVYVIAAYHDTGLAFGRERHHIDAGRILAEDAELRRRFDSERIATMREAVEDHRASSGHAPFDLRPHRRRSRPLHRHANDSPPHGAVRAGALPGADARGALRPLPGTPPAQIRRRRLSPPLAARIGQCPAARGACGRQSATGSGCAASSTQSSTPRHPAPQAEPRPDRSRRGGGGTVASATDGPDTKKIRRRIASRHRRPPSFAGKPDRPDTPESRGRRAGPETVTPPRGGNTSCTARAGNGRPRPTRSPSARGTRRARRSPDDRPTRR